MTAGANRNDPMRVLTLVHQFLPKNVAGTEVYTLELARELRARGHSVHLLFSEVEPGKEQGAVTEGSFDGIPFHRIACQFRFREFSETYANPAAEPVFDDLLRSFRPDVVHAQHLQTLSTSMPARARRSGVPFVMTLAEYALVCPLWGQLIRRDSVRCGVPSPAECGACLAAAPFFSDLLAGRDAAAEVARRRRAVADMIPHVSRFVAPSRFLLDRFAAFGFPSEKMIHLDYGFRTEGYERTRPPRKPGSPVRFGYVGSWVPYKGVHLLPEAFAPLESVPGWTLDLFGNPESMPDYARPILDAAARSGRIAFRGPFPPGDVSRVLASLDVLVVPSIWYENSPLTIHEAFLAGVPVLTSRLGGMRELVEDGKSGLLFEPGSASDLRDAALRLVREEGLLENLRRGLPRVKTIAENAIEMEGVFEESIAAARAARGGALRRFLSVFRPRSGRGGGSPS